MINNKYSEGDLVVGKLGTNPWWPGIVLNSPKTNTCHIEIANNPQVYVKFLEINTESWIEFGNIINSTSRLDMELHLNQTQQNSSNSKFLNYVPPAMAELYSKAWKIYDKMQMKNYNYSETSRDKSLVVDKGTLIPGIKDKVDMQPCEICLIKKIDFNYSESNRNLLKMNVNDRKIFFNNIMIDSEIDKDKKCSNYCLWKYHDKCVNNEDDLICSCNKSIWICSICDEIICVAQLFVCDNHECMRPYHRSCLSGHLELSIDMKHCPLHHCINCSLDYLEGSKKVILVHCVKCKLAFHNNPDCLPATFIHITSTLIICHRHLVDTSKSLVKNCGFCFACGSGITDKGIYCKFCMVSYHNKRPCLPSSIELDTEISFICNGCRFPYIHRATLYMLTLPSNIEIAENVHMLQLGVPVKVDRNNDGNVLTIRDDDGNNIVTHISRTISISLQSLDHLMCFGRLRFNDMQRVMRHMANIVSRVKDQLEMHQRLYRNAFILQFAGLFPVVENVYDIPIAVSDPDKNTEKCKCVDLCLSKKCPNVSSNMECTIDNCSSISRCMNRRLQKHQYPRCRIVIDEEMRTRVMLEESVVKDILVTELVGHVKSKVWAETQLESSRNIDFVSLSVDLIVDCNQFCNLSRFINQSDKPNLQPRHLLVAGIPRIGLFSIRRIIKGENLTIDSSCFKFKTANYSSPLTNIISLRTWQELDVTSADKIVTTDDSDHVIDLSKDDTEVSIEDNNCTEKMPLCPYCLTDLVMDYSSTRLLIHCTSCYSVYHVRCATAIVNNLITNFDTISSQSEFDQRLSNYICPLCVIRLDL